MPRYLMQFSSSMVCKSSLSLFALVVRKVFLVYSIKQNQTKNWTQSFNCCLIGSVIAHKQTETSWAVWLVPFLSSIEPIKQSQRDHFNCVWQKDKIFTAIVSYLELVPYHPFSPTPLNKEGYLKELLLLFDSLLIYMIVSTVLKPV